MGGQGGTGRNRYIVRGQSQEIVKKYILDEEVLFFTEMLSVEHDLAL